MPLSGSHINELQILLRGDASRRCTPTEVSGSALPWTQVRDPVCLAKCQHLLLKPGGHGKKPNLSLGNSKGRKQMCKPAGREDSDGHWLTLEADVERNHCQCWITSLCKGPGTVKPQLRRGVLVALLGYWSIQPSQPQLCWDGLEKAPTWTLCRRQVPVAEVLLSAQARRLGLSVQTHTSLNERSHSRASAYFKSTSWPAHQLLHMQQLAAAEGPAPPCGSWQLEGVVQPSAFLPCYTCRPGKQKSHQLTRL